MNQNDVEAYERACAAMKAAGVSFKEAAEAFRQVGLAADKLERQMRQFAIAQSRELIAELRAYYDMQGGDDWDVLVATEGTLGRALIELRLAWRRWWKEVWA